MNFDLSALAALAVILLVGVYVALDGFDIGVGVLLPGAGDKETRDDMLRSSAPTRWTSECWLIAAAAAMYVAFPFPFWALAHALALPIGAMFAALGLRVWAGAQRMASAHAERTWSFVFAFASGVVALAQGFCLGGYIRGVSVAGGRFVGGLFDWASSFSALVAVALTIGYALLGATWLIWRGHAPARERAQRWSAALAPAAAVAMAAISVATLMVHPTVSAKWGVFFDGIVWRFFLPRAPLPIAAAISLAAAYFGARGARSALPFCAALCAFAAGYVGLVVSVWPYVVPYGFTAAGSAADAQALLRCLVGVAIAAPCLALVSALGYRLRRASTA